MGRRTHGETLNTSETSRPLRIDYLGYDTTAGQWRYVSIEARILVAPMSASSFARDTPERITVRFEPKQGNRGPLPSVELDQVLED